MAECGTQQKPLSGLSRFRYAVALDKGVYHSTENNDIKIFKLVLAAETLPSCLLVWFRGVSGLGTHS